MGERLSLSGKTIKAKDVQVGDLIEMYTNAAGTQALRFVVTGVEAGYIFCGHLRYNMNSNEEVSLIKRTIKEPQGLGAIVKHERGGLLVRIWDDYTKAWLWRGHESAWSWPSIEAGVTEVVQEGVLVKKMVPGSRPEVPLTHEIQW